MDALAELPQNFKEVVVLVDLGDFSYQEAADILEIPIGTVMSRLHRGRRALKKALAESVERGRHEWRHRTAARPSSASRPTSTAR